MAKCAHRGWALWMDHWQWWCGMCGHTEREYGLLNFPSAHTTGDLWQGR